MIHNIIVTMRKFNQCKQCEYEWFSNLMEGQLPTMCPLCRSRVWLTGRKRRKMPIKSSNLSPITQKGEQWYTIKDFPGYLASSLGRVFSLKSDKLIPPKGGYIQIYNPEGRLICRRMENFELADPFIKPTN